MITQHELTTPSPLLTPRGRLSQVGWARQPLLDCNLEAVRFYPALLRPLQRLRVKRWDYYAVTTPERFFSVTLADPSTGSGQAWATPARPSSTRSTSPAASTTRRPSPSR